MSAASDFWAAREVDFSRVLDVLAANRGADVMVNVTGRGADGGIVLETKGELGELDVAHHGVDDPDSDEVRMAARFPIGDTDALNVHAVDFDRAEELPNPGWLVIYLKSLEIDVRGLAIDGPESED